MADVLPLHPYAPPVDEKSLFAPDASLRTLIPGGSDLVVNQTFGEDDWDLAGHPTWSSKAGDQTVLAFSRLSPRWRVVAKHLALFQMDPQLAGDLAPSSSIAERSLSTTR